ncbi:MAG: gliding motility-associated C-terminal domain-containing protein [Flavobacteriales bacterium]|nr:gliding motility-associated C-terminal domain-containing protein [Flavobacteriales bacterium]
MNKLFRMVSALYHHYRKALSMALFGLLCTATFAQFDTEFWMPPIWNSGVSSQNNPSELFITTPYPTPVNVHIETPDGVTFVLDTTVVSGEPLSVPLTPSLGQTQQYNTVITNNGFLVTSNAPIQCVHKVAGQFNQTLVTLKGPNGLGQEFYCGSQVRNMNAMYGTQEHHFISVMALENNTTITFDTPYNMYDGGGTLANPFVLTLDQYECYLIRGNGPTQHVAGAHVTSDKDIAVISGSTHTRILGGGAADGGVDQLVPIELMGKEFVFIKGDNNVPFDYAIVIATEDNTAIYLDGSATPLTTIDQGEYYDITTTGSFGDAHYIKTDKVAYCYHVTGASLDDEVGMSALPQIDCTGSRYIEFSKFASNASNQIMNVICPPDAEPTLEFNNIYYQSVPGAIYGSVPGKPGWISVSFPNSALQDDNLLTSEGFFHAGFLTGNAGSSGTYGFLSGFNDAFEFLDPNSGLPTTIYMVDTLCGGQTIDHCLEVFSCGIDHNIIDFEGNDGTVVITPASTPFDTCFSYTAPFNYSGLDTITFTVDNSFGFTGSVDVVFMVVNPNTPIDAGPIQELCSETTGTLSAINPDPWVDGYWTVLAGGATLVDPNSPTTQVTNLSLGTNTFLWTQDYGCQTKFDITQIIVYDGTAPVADAGDDVDLCSDDNTFNMQANDPQFTATGTWEIILGSATIWNINDPNALVTNLGIGENIFEWNIDNGPCPGGSTVDAMSIFVFDQNHPQPDVGPDQDFCSDAFTSASVSVTEPIFPAVGQWELVSGSGDITDPLDFETTITNCGIGENVFAWVIDNGPCGELSDTLTITIYDSGVAAADAGTGTQYCTPTTSHIMDAAEPAGPGQGTWTLISGAGVIVSPNDPTSVINNLAVGDNIFQWTIDNGPCANTGDFDQVTITIFDESQDLADAGTDQEFCAAGFVNAQLDASEIIYPGEGLWTVVSGTGTFADPTDPNTTVSGLSVGSNVFQWTVGNGPCNFPTLDTVEIVIFDDNQNPADAGPDVSFCTPTSTYVMQAVAPTSPSVGEWTLISGTGTINNVNNPNSNISGLGIGENIFRWTILNGPCPGSSNFDEVSIFIFDENAPAADAGDDQEWCSDAAIPVNINLAANAPIFPGTGMWTLIQGSGTIVDPTDPNTAVMVLGEGENIFEWQIDNGPCPPNVSTDQVSIFVYPWNQAAANAGPDQDICSDNPTTVLAANSTTFPASGMWSVVSGSGTFADASDPNTTVSGLSVGINVLEWTIDNGPCDPSTTSDQVTILVFDASLAFADAGSDQTICSSAGSIIMSANDPVNPATGVWTVISGSGDFSDANDPEATVTNLSVGTNVFQWTVDNGPCSGSTFDQMTVVVYDATSPAANAGPNQSLCTPTTSTNLAANTPVSPAVGTWTLVSGTGTISNANDPGTLVTGLAVGANVFQWSINNSPCAPATTVDQVTIFVYNGTATTALAGSDQEFCTPVSSTLLNGNAPVYPATGVWTLVSGSGTIVSPSNPNTQVTGLAVGENIFEWTITSGPCAVSTSSDQMSVFIYDNNQAPANAGADQEYCSDVTTATMAANAVTFPATGSWTLVSGTGVFDDPSDPNTGVSGLTIGTNVFQWTIDNGPCGAPTSDTMTILIYNVSAPNSDAGPDQDLCTPTTSTTMSANVAEAPAVGTWSLVSGSGSIANVNDPNTAITGLGIGENVFQWTLNNGTCSGGETSDQVIITVFNSAQANAAAGIDQNLCTPQTSTFLNGNNYSFPAQGTWSLVSGSGTIADPNDPQTEVTALAIGENIFQWTITNGPCANSLTTDQVSIFVFDGGAPQANAGIDQELCSPTTTTVMTADAAVSPGTGVWSLIGGTGTITTPSDPNTGITNLSIGVNTFVWTLDYATCGTQSDTVQVIVYDSTVPAAEAGPDQELCTPTSSTALNADAVNAPGYGTWSLVSGSGTFADANDPGTTVDNLSVGENIFVWTVYNGPCLLAPETTDTISVFVFDVNQASANAGADQEWCTPTSSTFLDGNSITFPAIGTWTLISGSGTIADPNDPETEVTGLAVGENVFQWSVDNGSCAGALTTDQVSIFVYDQNQPAANAGPDQEWCTPVANISLAGSSVTYPGSGVWTLVSGTATILDPANPNATVTGLAVGENIFQWTVDNGPCSQPTSDVVSIFIFSQFNDDANAGADQELCTPDESTNLAGNTPIYPASGMWTLVSGSGTIAEPANPNTLVTGLTIGENIFMWTVDNGPCANGVTTDVVSIFVFDANAPLANAGADQEFCTPVSSTFMDATDPVFPTSGTWTLVSGSATIVDANDPQTEITNLAFGENIFQWTVYNGPCSTTNSTDLVSIFIFDENQADANAGADQLMCMPQNTTLLNGNPAIYPATGTWTLVSGSGTIVNPSNPNTQVTNLGIGNNVFAWTILNGPCANATTIDEVTISVFDNEMMAADAGPDQEFCMPTDFAVLNGNTPVVPATGVWTQVQGTGNILDPTSPLTSVVNLGIGENIFAWTVSNGPCGTTEDLVSIFIYDPAAPVADAGADQEFCTPVSTTVMTANTPADPGVGTWELIGGNGTIQNVNNPSTNISGLTIGENIFTWTIYNGPCAEPTVDTVSIFIFDENAPDADAGNDVEICLPLNEVQMDANAAIFPALGTWTLVSGSGTIVDPNDENTMITGLGLGTNTFMWTLDNTPCNEGITSDTVDILVFEEEIDPIYAGPDQFLCTPVTTVLMAADAISDPNTGFWTVADGTGVFGDATDPNTIISGLTVGINQFVWHVDNGPCTMNMYTDTVDVYIYDEAHPAADAGLDQELCLPVNTTDLDGNLPIVPAIGTWTLIEGSATIVDPNDPNTDITDLAVGVNTFVWTIDNGPCDNTMTADTVSVLVFEEDALLANAGENIELCTPQSCVTLNAETPSSPTTGTWTWVEGGGTISDVNDPNAEVCALTVGHHVLQWEIYNGPCTNNYSFDFVEIDVYDANANPSNAGEDQELCWPTNATVLEADIPMFPAVGTWDLIDGSGSISDLNDPNADFTELSIGISILTWTVYNGPCNEMTIDTVQISVFDPMSPNADAGEDQWFCTPFGGTNLEGNMPAPPATGTWTLISGSADIDNASVNNTAVNNLGLGENIFVWTVYNGACANSSTSDTVSVFVNDLTVAQANAGADLFFCGAVDSLMMDGSETIGNTAFGEWTILQGGGTFANTANEHSMLYDIPVGVNEYVWTVDNGACGISTDTMQIVIYDPLLDQAFAGFDEEICQDEFVEFNLEANAVEWPATGWWEILEGDIEISDLNDPSATVLDLGTILEPLTTITNVLVWTVDNGVCGTTSDTLVYVLEDCLTLDIPDAFSPNGDGINDVFEIPNLYKYPNNSLKIFNRWGMLVYESAPYFENWDGTSSHPATIGQELPVSTYYYILDLGNGAEAFTGYIYLKR